MISTMAFSHFLCFSFTLFVFGVSSSWGDCQAEITKCLKPTLSMASMDKETMKNVDLTDMCKKNKEAEDCIQNLKDCPEQLKKQSVAGIEKAKQKYGSTCEGTGEGGDMGSCKMADIMKCVKKSETEKEACKVARSSLDCIKSFEKKCKNKSLQDMIKTNQENMEKTIQTCKEKGYSVGDAGESIKPSYILTLAAAILFVVRLNF